MPLYRRIPKRGFNPLKRKEWCPVNVASLARFDEGAEVGPEQLRQCGLVRGRWAGVKVLGTGELSKPLTVRAHAFSAAAQSKIEAAGGTCERITA